MRTRTSTGKGRRRLVLGVLAAVAVTWAAAVPAQAATYVYVGSNSGDVFQYGLDTSGALSPLAQPSIAAGSSPSNIAVSPNARWVYVANTDGQDLSESVLQFDLGRGGLLAPMTPPAVSGQAPLSIAVSPDHGSVYAANLGGTLSQYDVGTDGTLSPKNPPLIILKPAGLVSASIAVSPDGRSVYVANAAVAPGSTTNLIYQFDVGTGGALTPKNPPTVAAGSEPGFLAVSPDGRSVYVPNAGSNTVAQYAVDADGALSLERSVGAGDGPSQVVVSPDGESVYLANFGGEPGSGDTGSVFQYDIGAGGALTPKRPRSVSAGMHPTGIGVSPDGGSVYVTDFGNPSSAGAIYQFDVGGSDDTLSAKNPASVPAGANLGALAVSPAFATPGPDLLTGTAGDDVICGLGGSDEIRGLGGDDKLYGDRCGAPPSASAAGVRAGAAARAGHDTLVGGPGRDRLYGGRGRDRLRGGAGRDRLRGGAGRDWLRGGRGRDTLDVRGGGRDRVHCGDGRDMVRADKRDTVRRCERIIRR